MKKRLNITIFLLNLVTIQSLNAQLLKRLKEQVKSEVGQIGQIGNLVKGNAKGLIVSYNISKSLANPSSKGIIVLYNDEILTGIIDFISSAQHGLGFQIENGNGIHKYYSKEIRAVKYGNSQFYFDHSFKDKPAEKDLIYEKVSDGEAKLFIGYRFNSQTKAFELVESVIVKNNGATGSSSVDRPAPKTEILAWMATNFADYKPLVDYIKSVNETRPLQNYVDAYNAKSMDPFSVENNNKTYNQDNLISNEAPNALNGSFIRTVEEPISIEKSYFPENRSNIKWGNQNIGYIKFDSQASNVYEIYAYNGEMGKDMMVAKTLTDLFSPILTLRDNKKQRVNKNAEPLEIVAYLIKNGYL